MGFSIKMNTLRRTPHTNELVKQQFCCNKYKKPKVDDGGAEGAPVLDTIPDPKVVVGDEELEDEPSLMKTILVSERERRNGNARQ
jgi:hypothetical protein